MTITRDVRADHIGFVTHDIRAEVARWRGQGYLVSEPVALIGESGRPLGQDSAHIVFDNGYVELSQPTEPGNHLQDYLRQGEGWRILVLRADDIASVHASAERAGLAEQPPRDSSRTVRLGNELRLARFRWFPVKRSFWPAVLVAVVEHLTPEIVWDAQLRSHPNGARRIDAVQCGAKAPPASEWAPFAEASDGIRLGLGGVGLESLVPIGLPWDRT